MESSKQSLSTDMNSKPASPKGKFAQPLNSTPLGSLKGDRKTGINASGTDFIRKQQSKFENEQ